jgi:hypothetical protein
MKLVRHRVAGTLLCAGSLFLASCSEPTPPAPNLPTTAELALLKSIADGGNAAYDQYVSGLAPGDDFRGSVIKWRYHKKYGIDRLAANPEELEMAVRLAIDYPESVIPGAEDWVGGYYLAVCCIWVLVDLNDDANLVRLISRVPMEVVGPDGVYIEGALTSSRDRGSVDGLRVLFDAYQAAQSIKVKSSLANAARRAFWKELRAVRDNDEAIAKAQQLFEARRKDTKFNLAYLAAYTQGDFDIGEANGVPLLIPKEGPDFVESP